MLELGLSYRWLYNSGENSSIAFKKMQYTLFWLSVCIGSQSQLEVPSQEPAGSVGWAGALSALHKGSSQQLLLLPLSQNLSLCWLQGLKNPSVQVLRLSGIFSHFVQNENSSVDFFDVRNVFLGIIMGVLLPFWFH